MKNKKHYIVIDNPNPSFSGYDKYLVVPDDETIDPNRCYISYREKDLAEEEANRRNEYFHISDYAEDEIMDFYNSVDFKPVEDAVNNRLGLNLTYEHSCCHTRGDYDVTFESKQNLCELPEAGLMAKMLQECYIKQFSNGLNIDTKTGELYIWISINFMYKHFTLGSNGCEFCDAFYKNGTWKITFEEDRNSKVILNVD